MNRIGTIVLAVVASIATAILVSGSVAMGTRNGSGTYSLPALNPVVSGTSISSTWANNTMNDLASEMTNSLDRGGRGAMTAPLQLASGSQIAPGLTWSVDGDTGLWWVSANDFAASAGNTKVMEWTSTGVTANGSAAGVGLTGTAGGAGLKGVGTTNGEGVWGVGAGNGPGGFYTGGATADGLDASGGATSGNGVAGTGGATSGTGVVGTGGTPNGTGVSGFGTGTGRGMVGQGGSTADGVYGVGGAISGLGVRGQGTGTGGGVLGLGGATNGTGVEGVGAGTGTGVLGSSVTGYAGVFSGNATRPGIHVGGVVGDPSTPQNGDIWFDTTTSKLRKRSAGVTSDL